MAEQRMIMEVGSGRDIAMASSSTSNTTLPQGVLSTGYFLYPTPTATYDEVVASPVKFIDTLENLHAAMGSKFKIPIVGGHELDLHRLFVEVTSRGGLAKVLQEKKWKDVTGAFSFPSSATNASFILRKYYYSLLVHYEQIYFFRAVGWNHETINALQSSSRFPAPHHRSREMLSSTNTQATESNEFSVNPTKSFHEECSALAGSSVHGVIDGKFDGGYLITVKIGSEELKGVLYQSTGEGQVEQEEQESSSQQHYQNVPIEDTSSNPAPSTSVVVRRKRRKKSEIRKRDPAHPKPNRSGYNFFFQEQHARLKVLYPGKDREISRIIGDSWNKLNENEKSVYQEKAAKDKERYKMEMEGYRQRLKTGNNINNNTIESSITIQRSSTINLMNMVKKLEHDDEDGKEEPPSHHPPGIETSLSIAVKPDENQLHSLQTADNNNNNVIIVPISQSIPCNDQINNNNDNSVLDTNLNQNSSMIILPSDTVPVQSLQHPTDLNTSTIDLEKEFQADQENETCSSSSKTHSINLNSSSDMFFKDRIPVPEQEQEQQQQSQEMNDDGGRKRSNFEDDDRRLLLQMEKRDDEEGDERILSQNSIDVAEEEKTL